MNTLPEVGKEYTYLGRPVLVLNVIPMQGGSPDEALVEFKTRVEECGECKACFLKER